MQPGPSLQDKLQAHTASSHRSVQTALESERRSRGVCRGTTRSPTRPRKLVRCGNLSLQIRVRVSRKPSRPPKRSKEAETAQTSALDEDEDKEDADEVDEDNHQGVGHSHAILDQNPTEALCVAGQLVEVK